MFIINNVMQNISVMQLLKGQFGIEKESLRVDQNGMIVKTKHPIINKFSHPYIKVDFGEQQVELITNIHPTINEAIKEIQLLSKILYQQMQPNEYLWNYSMPLGPFDKEKIANSPLKKDYSEIAYREYLTKKTSIKMQLISGIHFNWSLDPKVSKKLSNKEINAFYFDIFKKYQKASFVIKKLFGFSPTKDFVTFDKISYRQSEEGYHNKQFLSHSKNYTSYLAYRNYINSLIKKQEIKNWKETYGPIRTKPFDAKRIEWLEIRNFDLDYQSYFGINEEALDFTHKFLIFLSQNTVKFEIDWLLKNFLIWLKKAKINYQKIRKIITNYYQKKLFLEPNIEEIIALQKDVRKEAEKINFPELANFELSTQILIKNAYLLGKKIKIINKEKNIIEIDKVIIEKATLNPFDDPKGISIIDSKLLTNEFLKKHNFRHTNQKHFSNIKKAIANYLTFKDQKIVIKPVKANFSHGITIFNFSFNENQFKEAIKYAFKFDDEILIERFVVGQEYRLLVINQQFVGALKRIPANVIGDGQTTIENLIAKKNQHPYRGFNYQLPLEKIAIDSIVKEYLKSQNLNLKSIVPLNKQIFLRQNSNISSGGDTIDISDQIPLEYQKIAVKISKKLKLQICGLDIIIPNLNKINNYTILELNWNPAIHIHTYPLIGKNRHPADFIIKMIEKFNHKN